MLDQDNGKNLCTKETKVVSQDCPKFLGSIVTCGSQRGNFRRILCKKESEEVCRMILTDFLTVLL